MSTIAFTDSLAIDDQATAIIYQGRSTRLFIPKASLAYGSVSIETLQSKHHFSQWTEEEHLEAYQSIKKIIAVWQQHDDVNDYLIYAADQLDEKQNFSIEIVPYYKNDWSFLKQLKVLFSICFGSSQSQNAQHLKDHYIKYFNDEAVDIPCQENASTDAFCDPHVIEKQSVITASKINVLFNYAPLGLSDKKWHFLFTPKQHRQGFMNLDTEEYLETTHLVTQVIDCFQQKWQPKKMYLFHKTGIKAGQAVPHWHAHLVFSDSIAHDLWGKLVLLKNMIFGSSPLTNEELQSNVAYFQEELQSKSSFIAGSACHQIKESL